MAEDWPKAQMSGGKAAFIAIALRTTRSTLRANCAPLPCVAMTWLDKLERRTVKADRKSTRLNSSHLGISYAVFCLKKKTTECERHKHADDELTRPAEAL